MTEKRQTLSCSASIKQKRVETYVHINVGIVRDNEKGVLTRGTGSKLSITVDREKSVDQILSIAKTKHSAHDPILLWIRRLSAVVPRSEGCSFYTWY